MAKVSVDETQLERPYTFFLFKSIAGIHESWIEGDVEGALKQACILVVHLPNDVKEVLWPLKEEIQRKMNRAYSLGASNFYQRYLIRAHEGKATAYQYLEPFMDKMIRLLDEKGWLERGALRPRYPDKKKLSVEAIEQ